MRNILSYFKAQTFLCIVFCALAVVTMLLGILEPKLTAVMVTAITDKDLNQMALFAILVAIVAISSAIVKFIVRNTAVNIRTKVGKNLEKDLCNQALNIKTCFISDFKSGELVEITKSDSSKFLACFQEAVMYIFSIMTAGAVAVYVTILSWQSTLLFAFFLLAILGIQKFSLNKEKQESEKEKDSTDTAKSLINQIYRGILEIKVLNLKQPIFDRYDRLLDEEILANKTKEKAKSTNRMFTNITFQVYVLSFMMLGYLLMKSNILKLSAFITIFMYKGYLYNLIFDVSELRSDLSEMRVLASRMNKLLKIEDFKLENFGQTNSFWVEKHKIELEHLSFSYDNNTNVLNDISFKISEGQFVGIVGESGSAKTTLIKLLSRQLEPTNGSFKLDGVDFSQYSEQSFTSLVSLASQEPFVFSFSIRENLLMVKPNATESQLWKSLEDAQILEFVKNLPNGIDTVLKETLNISGGQKQRLSLARLFLKDTPIILMDEATSALDNRTQAKITELIRQKAIQDNKIFICIAHRIEAVQDADIIYFLENGSIANSGTHGELLNDEKYLKLLNKS